MNEILKKRIEKRRTDYADILYPLFKYPYQHSAARASFAAGAQYALSHQWISVEEALPKSEDWVIVMYDVGLMEVRKGIYVRVNKPLCENIKITHWMPIPKFETNVDR